MLMTVNDVDNDNDDNDDDGNDGDLRCYYVGNKMYTWGQKYELVSGEYTCKIIADLW